ncbi:MAG: hypothetical protein ACWGOX_14615, partial [Desulforhopalus sp.]
PGDNETYLGLYNEQQDINFIPVFRNKEDANDCYLNLPREKGKKYELQAVHIEELHESASRNDFVVALVDGDGQLVNE